MCPVCESPNIHIQRVIEWSTPILSGRHVQRIRKQYKVMKCEACKIRWWRNHIPQKQEIT